MFRYFKGSDDVLQARELREVRASNDIPVSIQPCFNKLGRADFP
jgi:hypothetical protein